MSVKYNIVYFVCHDLGRALGCYGAGVSTPRLDAFAQESVRFTDAHCTSPACSPSRACAMTGLYAHASGALGLSHMGWPLDLAHRTIIDDLNAAGCETILSGVNHERHPRTDRYAVDLNQDWADWQSPRAVQQALTYLSHRERSRPFYLNIGTQDPHASTWHRVGNEIPELPDDDTPVWMPEGMLRTPALEAAFRRFAAAIAHMDHSFGQLLDGLKALGHDRDTIVIFTTDHGVSGPRAKGHLYGIGTEIALLIRRPDEPQGGTVRDHLIGNVDFRPTLCEAIGIDPVSTVQGRSFWPLMDDANADHQDAIFLERNYHGEKRQPDDPDYVDLYDPVRAVRTKHHLYIRNFHPDVRPAEPLPNDLPSAPTEEDWRTWQAYRRHIVTRNRPPSELYDLTDDPLEWVNRSGQAEMASLETACAKRLQEWMRETGDFIPDPPPPRPEPPGWGPHWK